MLRNVLEDYFSSIVERDFDYPLTSLLQAMGFFDIHFTHGTVEFGKDFIAKKLENRVEYQYVFQSKKGDINQSLWRNEIRGQLEEAILSELSHPQFDSKLPRRAVLSTTGRLIGNARLLVQEFKSKLEAENAIEDLIVWEKEQLIQLSEQFGLSGIHQNTPKGLKGFAQFFLVYGKAIDGVLTEREIEEYSRLWLDEQVDFKKRMLRASIEAEIIASKLLDNGLVYEAIITYLGLSRMLLQMGHERGYDPFLVESYNDLLRDKILFWAESFIQEFESNWESANGSTLLLCLRDSSFPMLQYLVWCSRVMEIGALFNLLSDDIVKQGKVADFLVKFIEKETGCGHIPSDRYAISTVWTVVALVRAGNLETAHWLVKKSVIWLCDKVESGFGLARYEADEDEQTRVLLGFPFAFIKVEKNRSSFLATALADLAAFLGDPTFYGDVVNDFSACEIAYSYWQFPDTKSIYTIDSEECLNYPNIPHKYSFTSFDDLDYASHLKDEPRSFTIVETVGVSSLVVLSVLLKDRYFPTMWKKVSNKPGSKTVGTYTN